jgi:hypothetical protein
LQSNEPPGRLNQSRKFGDSMAGSRHQENAKTPSKSIKHFEPGVSENWISIIKQVKSSDRQEITQAYEKVMPLVVEDWAHWLLSKPKTRRLPLIEQIAKHHGDSVGDMVKRKLTELHHASFQNSAFQQSLASQKE